MNDPALRARSLQNLFESQRRAFAAHPCPGDHQRRAHLLALERALRAGAGELAQAIHEDFGCRSTAETQLLEVFPSLEAIRHARRHVKRWMRPEARPVSLWFQPGRARVVWQPLGVVGIIVPWNYPLFLSLAPLAAALAAGNRVMIKMSELTPRTGQVLARLVGNVFPDDLVAVVNGDAAMAREFGGLPFDHLLFTGSTAVGREVMRAAAANLTPVTLELGGKSPAIVAPGFPLSEAADKIMYGKCANAGQTCVAPDYVLVPAGTEHAFVDAARAAVARLYPTLAANPDYSAVVNARHYARLAGYLEEARAAGATVLEINPAREILDPAARKLAPALVLGAPEDLRVMQEEIFGPILPVVPYHDLDAALRYIAERPRPLALYFFDRDPARIRRVLTETHSGGVTVNDVILHVAQESLPFGGVGPSGMGHYHGRHGFETFSKQKGVFLQSRLSGADLLKPPYGKRFAAMIRLLLR
ncbi:MAG TPA: coniferyl aldehyde dehydrogenase [Burkholderiales bacterium]|nr:coniferyl aldehyde dehydrogenase [Burkholderiales bacterium]